MGTAGSGWKTSPFGKAREQAARHRPERVAHEDGNCTARRKRGSGPELAPHRRLHPLLQARVLRCQTGFCVRREGATAERRNTAKKTPGKRGKRKRVGPHRKTPRVKRASPQSADCSLGKRETQKRRREH